MAILIALSVLTACAAQSASLREPDVPVNKDAVPLETSPRTAIPEGQELLDDEARTKTEYFPSEIFEDRWPEQGFSREELVATALVSTFAFFEDQERFQNTKKLDVYIDPQIPKVNWAWIQKLGKASLLPWSDDLDKPISLVVGMSNEYLREIVSTHALAMPTISPEKECDYDYGACTSADTIWVGWGNQPLETLGTNRGIARMLSHKSFHMIQDTLDWQAAGQSPPRSQPNFRPVWFIEGSAEFYGYAVNDYANLHKYGDSKLRIPYSSLRNFEEWQGLRPDNIGPYFWGQIATEYLVANVGFEGYIQIYRALEQGERFEDAFESGTGITLGQFYDSFDVWALQYSGLGAR